jgi:hypothetical protein
LERIEDLYKLIVYSGDKEQYTTFTTPEAAKEIDAYLEYRKRKGEQLSDSSYLIVKRFRFGAKTKPFTGQSLRSLLQDCIERTGLREIDNNPYKRKQVPILHAFRKFTTKQLHDSKLDKAIIELLLGHRIGLTSVYYKPTEKEMLNEYYKAVPLLTISNEERLKFKLEERIQIEKTRMESMEETMKKLQQEVKALKRKKR